MREFLKQRAEDSSSDIISRLGLLFLQLLFLHIDHIQQGLLAATAENIWRTFQVWRGVVRIVGGAWPVRVRRGNADGAGVDLQRLRFRARRCRVRLDAGNDVLNLGLKPSGNIVWLHLILNVDQLPRTVTVLYRLTRYWLTVRWLMLRIVKFRCRRVCIQDISVDFWRCLIARLETVELTVGHTLRRAPDLHVDVLRRLCHYGDAVLRSWRLGTLWLLIHAVLIVGWIFRSCCRYTGLGHLSIGILIVLAVVARGDLRDD